MIQFMEAGLTAALRERGVAGELARHFHEADSARLETLAATVAPFLVHIVDALRFVLRAAHDSRAGRAIAFANGQVLGYLLDDRDLLSEREHGVLGLLDDAYLVHHHAAELMAQYPWLEAHAMGYEVPAAAVFNVVARLLPEGIAPALERASRVVVGVATALIGTQPGTEVASSLAAPIDPERLPPPARLRLDESYLST